MTDEVILIAQKDGHVYEYRGPNEQEFPVKLDGLTTDFGMSVDNHAHRITLQLNGASFYTRPLDSDDGQTLAALADDLDGLRDKDEILATVDEYLDEVEG